MVDVVADLAAATDAALAEIASLVAEIQKDLALLATLPVDNTVALEAQIKRLTDGTAAAAAAVAALQTPAPAPAPDAPAPAPDAPSPAPAPGPTA